jgi:predicted metal-dependent enzyme (double-stranded beta helix superfamily)
VFEHLMQDRDWLPDSYRSDAPHSGMGGGIGQWLIYRSASRDLCLFSLVVPPGAMTPIHDHLAWGLIGLYQGNQDEEIYRPGEGAIDLVRRRPLQPGDFYTLLPPRDDVHRVRTTSVDASVSIHLLANDTGCVLRHTYDERTGEASPFRSGYVNAECDDDPVANTR